jgi:lipid-A-disaccharide synthase
MSKTIFFSVGEPSGDQHAARLISEILSINSETRVRGFGGPAMAAAGCRLDLDLTGHAVVGILEVLPKLREFFRFADQAEQVFQSGSVDAVVLVDFPGFNWHIAKRAKRYGIPVHYYCPPQLWAWGGWRIKKLRRYVDHVLTVLPIEQDYFSKRGVPCTYVGHPFFDAVAESQLDSRLLTRLQQRRQRGDQLVAVLPGSREHEVHRSWPLMVESIRRLHRNHPRARFLVASYRDSQCIWCRDQLEESDAELPIEFYVNRSSEVIEASRCAMMVSGSVSLEMMARKTPAAVIYRVGRVLHWVAKRLVHLDSMTLPNLIAGRQIFPEMVSVGPTEPAVEFLTESVDAMLGDQYYFRQLMGQLDLLCWRSARGGASRRAAEAICKDWDDVAIRKPVRPRRAA